MKKNVVCIHRPHQNSKFSKKACILLLIHVIDNRKLNWNNFTETDSEDCSRPTAREDRSNGIILSMFVSVNLIPSDRSFFLAVRRLHFYDFLIYDLRFTIENMTTKWPRMTTKWPRMTTKWPRIIKNDNQMTKNQTSLKCQFSEKTIANQNESIYSLECTIYWCFSILELSKLTDLQKNNSHLKNIFL